MLGALLALGLGIVGPAAGSADQNATFGVWTATAQRASAGSDAQPKAFRSYELDQDAIAALLAQAPRERTAAAENAPLVLSLPGPGGFPQRFALQDSPIMQAGLARAHPEIRTYSGRGVDDPAATIRADVSPLGFHASIRSPNGNWYIDPSSKTDEDAYIVYYTRDLPDDPDGPFQFKEGDDEELAAAAVELSTNGGGPSAGDVLRTYRLALVTDQSYATYFGAANVTAAKVALMNRVNQVYEDETSIRLVLINDTDKTNLNTDADAILPNGPCGSAGCFTAAQLSSCGSLGRIRTVLGQIIGASNYDIGHLGLGKNGGGVANLGVVGGNAKAQGCTGLPNPEGDFYAVDYVAHEMGHQFAGNHTFNGTQVNCSGGNRNAATSVEPGSGTSIMAYAGICRQDDTQPHSDPYWSQRSFEEITTYVTSVRPPINEVQTASLRDFDGTDSFKLELDGAQSTTITNGTNYSAAGIQLALQGVSEVQTVGLVGYDGTDSYTLEYRGATSVPIVRGQNNTAAGIQNALQGGNEQQQAVLTGFSAATQTFQIEANGNTSAVFGLGGLTVSNANVTAQINALLGSTGVTSGGAGNGGFTLTFGGTLAGVDVAPISIVNCSGACVASVRENAKGGGPIAGWPAAGTVAVTALTDAGYTLTFGGTHQGTDVDPISVTNGFGVTGAVVETAKGSPGMLPPGAAAIVAGFGAGTFNTTGFQVTFGGTHGLVNVSSLAFVDLTGATGFVGETAKGGPIDNQGWQVTPTGNSPPAVQTPVGFTIPYRTPFALTGSATDADGDTVTYLWEQNDIGVGVGTALVNPLKTNGPLFRQFGTALDASIYDPKQLNSPGENHVTTDPTRTFPDLAQILINNTNAVSGDCPGAPAPPSPPTGGTNVPQPLIDCYSEWLPTASYLGPLHFRLTGRDGHPAGGGIESSDTTISLAPGTGPFLVTSQGAGGTVDGHQPLTVTWDVAGTDLPPIAAENVKISMSADGGFTYPHVLAESTPNDGSAEVSVANVATAKARLKVEAVGNVFFDLNDADFAIQGVADVTNDAPLEGAVVQYSDALSPTVTVSATDPDTAGSGLTAVASGLPAGMTLADGTTSAGATLPGTHTWTVAGRTTAAPGTYPVTVTVTDDANHVSTSTFTIVVTQEDATPSYTGDELVFPAGGASSASVNLRAVVRDSSVVPASGDSAPGDIRKATVSFKEGAATLCGPLAVALLGSEETIGAAGCTVSLAAGSHTIDVLVDGYYVGSVSQVVQVLSAEAAHVGGNGELVLSRAAGSLGPASGTLAYKLDANFKVEKVKANNRPNGSVEIEFRAGGKDYLIRSFDLDSVGVALRNPNGSSCPSSRPQACIGLGDVRATATLFDVTKKQVKLATGLRLHVTATDGLAESDDAIGITLWDGNELLFSSNWSGGDTAEQRLSRGTIKIDLG